MPGKVKVNGVWKDVATISAKVNGSWKDVVDAYSKVNGIWEQWYQSALAVVAGYFLSGEGGVGPKAFYRYDFATDAVSTVGSFSFDINQSAGFSNPNVAGYYYQGDGKTGVNKLTFPTHSTSSTTSLPGAYQAGSGMANAAVAGYFTSNGNTTVAKYAFPADSVSTFQTVSFSPRVNVSFSNQEVAGYIHRALSDTAANKVSFPSDTVSFLSIGKANNGTAGFANTGVAGYHSEAGNTFGYHKLTFSSETTSNIGAPTAYKNHSGMAGAGLAGYHPVGDFENTTIYKLNFATDSWVTTTSSPDRLGRGAAFADSP